MRHAQMAPNAKSRRRLRAAFMSNLIDRVSAEIRFLHLGSDHLGSDHLGSDRRQDRRT
jgi:hypothetical protein